MLYLLKRKLNRLGAHADPRPLFLRTLERRLNVNLNYGFSHITVRKWIVSAASVVALVGSGTVSYAYTSDRVLPDHPLYSVRTALENIEESLATNRDKKVDVGLKIIKRRLREVEVLSARKQSDLKHTKSLIRSTLDRAHTRTLLLPEPTPKETQEETQNTVAPSAPQEEMVKRVDLVIEATEEGSEIQEH